MKKLRNTIDPIYRITQLARMFGLSRSTLLYYDRIGLLRPSERSPSNYRVYSETDRQRLVQICRYRSTGLPLSAIAAVLAAPRRKTVSVLEQRLDALNREIQILREQQRIIVDLLKDRNLLNSTRTLDKRRWVAVLRAAGLDEQAMQEWHTAFERMSPEAHQDFLESLGIAPHEITEIRSWSARDRASSPTPVRPSAATVLAPQKIDHICIAVNDLDAARQKWQPLLGKSAPDDAYVDDREKIRVARYWIGEVGFELMESTAADGPVARWIDKHGEGIMLISFNVNSTRAVIAALQAKGYPFIRDRSGQIARPFRDGEFAFIHPRQLNGVLTELIDNAQDRG